MVIASTAFSVAVPLQKPFPNPAKCRLTSPRMSARPEDPVAQRVRNELAENGVNLDELLNASRVIDLTRQVDALTAASSQQTPESSAYAETQRKIDKLSSELEKEKRQVMQGWLKKLFLGQAVVCALLGGVLSMDPDVPLVGNALGFWGVWLFSIPALRARKGLPKWEKSALNIAFVAMPLTNVLLPVWTKNTGGIWAADVSLLLAAYAWYWVKRDKSLDGIREEGKVKGWLKYLDWGSWR